MKKLVCRSFVALALLASPAWAEEAKKDAMPPYDGMMQGGKMGGEHMHMGEHFFKEMDANGDGTVTREEHEAFAKKKFDSMDTNGDGKITQEEFKARGEKMREEWKKRHEDFMKNKDAGKKEAAPSPTEGHSAQ